MSENTHSLSREYFYVEKVELIKLLIAAIIKPK